MTHDKYDILGEIHNAIGIELSDIVGGDHDRTLLFTEAGDGWAEHLSHHTAHRRSGRVPAASGFGDGDTGYRLCPGQAGFG